MESRSWLKGITAAAVVIFGCLAMAEEVTTDRTITLSANSDTSYEIADGVTLTVEVASGSTYTLSGQIMGTGSAKLFKTGLGTLALSNGNNDIPGGIDIAEGTVRADVAGALGDGELRIVQGETIKGNVTFNVAGETTETWSRFSCRLKFEGAPRVGRGAPRFIDTTGWIYVVREYETPKDLKLDSCVVECSFLDAKGRALVDGLRLEEMP